MNAQRSLLPVGLVFVLLVIAGLIFWSNSRHTNATGSPTTQNIPLIASNSANALLTTVQPPDTCSYCEHNLVGKTAAEVGQFAQDWAKQQLKAKSVPQVLLTRLVDAQALSDLGLGCGIAFASIEQPPMILIILKGEFDFRSAAPGFGQLPPPIPGKDSYVVYVFDAWAGSPSVILPSLDGALVKKALHDPVLPDNSESMPSVCATPIPASEKYLHYGEEAPGFVVPAHTATEVTPPPDDTPMPPSTAIPVGTYVPITMTPWAPSPVPTVVIP